MDKIGITGNRRHHTAYKTSTVIRPYKASNNLEPLRRSYRIDGKGVVGYFRKGRMNLYPVPPQKNYKKGVSLRFKNKSNTFLNVKNIVKEKLS